MKIYLDEKAFVRADEIKELIQKEFMYNCAFSGMNAVILRDDFTWIDGIEDEYAGTFLLAKINDLIEG